MFDFERLLVPGCIDLPQCRCGKEMQITRTHRLSEKKRHPYPRLHLHRVPSRDEAYRLGRRHSGLKLPRLASS